MTKEELEKEIRRLEQEEQEARKKGWDFQAAMFKQKKNIARSYLIDPATIRPGTWVEVEEYDEKFHVDYLNGVMAWGRWEDSAEKVAIPLAVIKTKPTD
jgi:hypothetical protein